MLNNRPPQSWQYENRTNVWSTKHASSIYFHVVTKLENKWTLQMFFFFSNVDGVNVTPSLHLRVLVVDIKSLKYSKVCNF